jgi:hypothetical protein
VFLQRVPSGAELSPILDGAGTAPLPEHAGEVLLGLKATGECDVKDADFGLSKQFLGPLDPGLKDEAMRRQAGGLLEKPGEVSRAEACDIGELL